jgi:hypothetical protein
MGMNLAMVQISCKGGDESEIPQPRETWVVVCQGNIVRIKEMCSFFHRQYLNIVTQP